VRAGQGSIFPFKLFRQSRKSTGQRRVTAATALISVGPDSADTVGPDRSLLDGQRGDRFAVERRLSESHAVLWAVVILSSLFDVVTTMVGLERGLGEGNAVARAFIETYGTPGIGLLKFSALVVVVLLWTWLDDQRATAVLAGFALVSLVVVALNAVTLATS
jgi:hypothetical protein